jgi:hypothetical protein
MKTKIPSLALAGLILTCSVAAESAQYTPRPTSGQMGAQSYAQENPGGLGLAFVTFLDGDSVLRSADTADWVALSPNLSLRIGDRVWAHDDARIEIRFPLGATAWVNYQSELDISRLDRGSLVDTIQLALVAGEGAFDVKGFDRPGSVFQVDIPNVSIRAFHAARFRVNTLPDGTAQIGVIDGSVVIETPDGLTEVNGGQMAQILPDRRVLLDFLPASDAWDGWVRSRADMYDRPAASLRYLPPDLSSYAHEFDNSGRWTDDPAYGSVWVPTVEQGWSPYSNGRWIWQANDYVWLPFDPWYAPFHYGRWNWGVSIGWFWIVPRGRAYWSPGYVGWSISDEDVSWVPLGYEEPYYGYGNYGPGNVNVFKTVNINVTHVYINSRVNNGVVVVRRDNFLRGRITHERITPRQNPFQGGGAGGVKIIGRPPVLELKPLRETRQSRPEVASKPVSPPPARLERTSKTIQERVLAPTKEKSSFKPGNTPPPLKNVIKEKQLEQWVPPKKAPPSRPEVAPLPVDHPPTGVAPGRSALPPTQVREAQPPPVQVHEPIPAPGHVREAQPPPVQVHEPQPPPGKHKFVRVPEPKGGANLAPIPTVVPVGGPPGQNERPPGEDRGKEGND